jgi:radical SAM superfamily enzyme YgiQ (UPF0313 family)
MPVGFLAIADLLHRSGHEVEVLHHGLGLTADPEYQLVDAASSFSPGLIAISLHWHHQLASVRQSIVDLKKHLPDAKIVIGGMTASFFYKEIMREWEQVDFVIRGDGEAPLWALARALDSGEDWKSTPNLSFREKDAIKHNELSYKADEAMLDRLDFANLSLMKNRELYSGAMSLHYPDGISDYLKERFFYLSPGRGCSQMCAWCAGSSPSHLRMHGRAQPVFRNETRIANDITRAITYGFRRFYVCFDPPSQGKSPYLPLMKTIRGLNSRVSLIFESYGRIPTSDFLSSFASTFELEQSALALSPEVEDEKLRKKYKIGYNASNEAIRRCLAKCAHLGIPTVLYFSLLPTQSFSGLKKSYAWALELSQEFNSRLIFMPLDMEPGAPWHLSPETFGIVSQRTTFKDFLECSRERDTRNFSHEPGYQFTGFKKQMDFIMEKGLLPSDHIPKQ